MKNLNTILLVGVGVLVLAVLVAPVSGGLIIAEEGATVTSVTGSTSPVIQVTDSPIADGGTITIDVSTLRYYFLSGSLADTNLEVQTTAAAPVVWTPSIDSSGDVVILTSSGGDTLVGDNVTVTFKGTTTEPWIPDSGYTTITQTATRTDTAETADITFILDTKTVSGRLSATDGAIVTTPTGATSPVFTILDSPIADGGTITINVENLGMLLFTSGVLTDANVEVTSSAPAPVVWTRSVSPDGKTLKLTSTGGATNPGDTVNLTFKGTAGNPWVYGSVTLGNVATRDDTAGTAVFTIRTDIAQPGGLTATDGNTITTVTGTTSPVITITNAPIAQDGTITIDTSGINPYVTGGQLNNANVLVTDTAAAATWTGSVTGNTLTLTSTGGNTATGETVTITFTGAGGTPWVDDSGAERIIPLTATRGDTLRTGSFNFVIDTGGRPFVNFSATPRSAVVPATISFFDLSNRSPVAWNWTFGDGSYSELPNPTHVYTTGGLYTISLNATNARGSRTRSEPDYIEIYRTGVSQADTLISGLTITNCGGPQTITVDTSVLKADLTPSNYVLEIQPLPDRGLKNITIHALNGFTRNGNLITGNPTSVHLVSADITPAAGFSPDIGTNAAFNWSADLSYYPCNAIISTNIRERISPENNALLLRIANGQTPPAVPKGTAYTATITRTNFPASVPVKLHMSINPSWRTSLDPTSRIFIWRISDDRTTGQILTTQLLSSDPIENLDYFQADSPLGMSTFGISAFTGNNNPFQLITFIIAAYIQPQNPAAPAVNENEQKVTPNQTTTPRLTVTPTPNATTPGTGQPQSVTAKLYTNAEGVITQATTLQSSDGFITVSIGKGIVAKDKDAQPLSSITLTPVPAGSLPGALPGGVFTFAGRAYELQPDGAVFTPSILLIFSAPPDMKFGQEFAVKVFDHPSVTWKDVPTVYDARTGQVTAQVSSFCCFALFTKWITAGPTAVVTINPAQNPTQPPDIQNAAVPPTAISTAAGLIRWIINLLAGNMIIVVVMLVLVAGFLLYERKHRHHR